MAAVGIDVPATGVVTSLAVVRFSLTDDAGDLVALTGVAYTTTGDFADAMDVALTQGADGNFPAGSLINLTTSRPPDAPATHSIT